MGTKLYLPSYPSMGEGGVQPAFKQSGGGGSSGPPPGSLVLPVYHNWEGETDGELPSFSEANPVDGDPMVIAGLFQSGFNYTKAAYKATSDISGVCIVDLGAPIWSEVPGIRLLIYAKELGSGNNWMEAQLQSHPTTLWQDDYTYFRIQENTSPDQMAHIRVIGGVEDFNEIWTGHAANNATGNNFKYHRFEQLIDGNTTWSVYDNDGTHMYTHTREYQGTAGVFPEDMRYFAFRSVNGANTATNQIWVGSSDDAWPTMPMSPISNL